MAPADKPIVRVPILRVVLFCLYVTPPILLGQTVPAQTENAPSNSPNTNEPLVLPVFDVSGEQVRGYSASSALSGTQTNEQLAHLPNSISIMTTDFLNDIAALDFFDAVEFAVSGENVVNDQGTRGAALGARSGNTLSFRGLPSVRQLRDGFPWYLPQDVFNTERIEFNRGPGGLAYGDVDAGGIINLLSKRPLFDRRRIVLATRFDDWGTKRAALDIQQTLIPGRLSLRLNAVHGEHHHWHQGMDTEVRALAMAVSWKVLPKTQITFLGERGLQHRGISHVSLTDQTAAYVRGTGTNALDAVPELPGNQPDGRGMFRTQAPGNIQRWFVIGGTFYNLTSTPNAVFRNSRVQEGNAATTVYTNPTNTPRRPISESIVARDEDWSGPTMAEKPDWTTYTFELKHEINASLNLLLAHNTQKSRISRATTLLGNQEFFGGRSVFIDVNPNLPDPQGTGALLPNPRYEEYYVVHLYNPSREGRKITANRGVLVYDAQLPAGITQRVVGSISHRQEDYFRDAWNETLSSEEIARRGLTGPAANLTNNIVNRVFYLNDGNHPDTLRAAGVPGVTQFTRSNSNNPTNARFSQSFATVAVNVLGSYFDGRLRSSLGLSRDRFRQKTARIGFIPGTGELSFRDADGAILPPDLDSYPVFDFSKQWVTNQSYGMVYQVKPWLSLTGAWLESAQFSDNTGIDINGGPLSPFRGKGYDIGARVNLLDGDVSISYVRFTTEGTGFQVGVPNSVRDELNALLPPESQISLGGGNSDSRSRKTTGDELEIFFSPTARWTGRFTYSTARVINYNSFPLLRPKIAQAKEIAVERGLDPVAATFEAEQRISDDLAAAALARTTMTLTTRYSFAQGKLKGLALGFSARYARGTPRVAVEINNTIALPASLTEDDVSFNPFASYHIKLGKMTWTTQVNVNNVFDRVTEQGTAYRFVRYTNPRQFIFSNTFTF